MTEKPETTGILGGSQCTRLAQAAGQPYPRTCPTCGLGPCRQGPAGLPPNMPSAVQPPRPAAGCICPPGANLQCENPTCPRKPPRYLSATATMLAGDPK
jgi:hypothetical protein